MADLFWRENLVLGLLIIQFSMCVGIEKRKFGNAIWILITVVLLFIPNILNFNWQWEGQIIAARVMLMTMPGRLLIFSGTLLQMVLCYNISLWQGLYFLAINVLS